MFDGAKDQTVLVRMDGLHMSYGAIQLLQGLDIERKRGDRLVESVHLGGQPYTAVRDGQTAIDTDVVSGVIALTLCSGAIASRTFRSSLGTVGREQLDASVAPGLPTRVRVTSVILPQALLRTAPTFQSNAISLVTESSPVSAVGMTDLMFVGQNISNNAARPMEVPTAVALTHCAIAFPQTRAVSVLQGRILRKPAVRAGFKSWNTDLCNSRASSPHSSPRSGRTGRSTSRPSSACWSTFAPPA